MDWMAFIAEQWILVVSLLILIVFFLYRELTSGCPQLSVHELTQAVNSDNAIVLDVRDNKEFKLGHIVNAINIPYPEISDSLEKLAKYHNQKIIVVDRMGQHTATASRQLTEKGFTVARLRGGIAEWQQQHLPLVK